MNKAFLILAVCAVPVLAGAQEVYGDAKAAKKVLIVRFDTPFKNSVCALAGKSLSDAGYYVEIVNPNAFKTPPAGTLVVYAEGGTQGTPWNDSVRNYLATQNKGIFFATFKRASKPFTAPTGVDVLTGASKDDQKATAQKIVDSVKKQL